MRSILVPTADRPECREALATAFELGARLGADVLGRHFRLGPLEPGNWDMVDLWTMNQRGTWPVMADADAVRAAEAAAQLFRTAAEQAGYPVVAEPGSRERPHASWEALDGSPPELMPAIGGSSDLLVVSRPPPRGGDKAWIVMMSALLDSLRPVLVLPQQGQRTTARRIAIAWNGGRTETLAVHAALPLVKAAEDVVLLTVAGGKRNRGPTSDDMSRWLARHGVSARIRHIERGDEGPALVETAEAEGADVLLAGAYTRGRLRQMVFGGVTELLVTKTQFPVVLMHS